MNLVTGLTPSLGGKIYSIGWDDRIREIENDGNVFPIALLTASSQPKSVAVAEGGFVLAVEIDTVEVVRSNQEVYKPKPKYKPSLVAASKTTAAIGGEASDAKVCLYEWDGKTLNEVVALEENKSVVSALAFSPDGKLLASRDSSRRIALFDVPEKKVHLTSIYLRLIHVLTSPFAHFAAHHLTLVLPLRTHKLAHLDL
ncbi:WD40 repeat-like protein [Stygiomarasmius scandens]|uniref:WD40 repeat-like protein n=1 Tax=Marasmiellus scandens TaxID=2682957 RepID=A0ABR1JK29_9AGAR